MKKLLLFISFLPALAFGQIKIGETVYNSLPEAGDAATENGDTITIAGAVTLETVYGFAKDKLVIKGVTPDAKIQFGADARMGFEQDKTITVENLTIVGTPRTQRQMWVANTCTAIFKNDTVRDCYNQGPPDEHGGAFLLVDDCMFEAYNCVFRNNKSSKNGGVFWVVGTAGMKLKNCVFIENKAQYENVDGKGGVAGIMGTHTNLLAENCAFIDNWSGGHAGAIWIEGTSEFKFINCTFSGNHADVNGGALGFWDGGAATLINCTMTANTCGESGGAIFMNFANNAVTLGNTILTGNSLVVDDESTADNINFDPLNGPYAITANNSYVASTDGLTVNGTGNITEGATLLNEPDVENNIYWKSIAAQSSVLVDLGDPAILLPYSTTDQRGYERKMSESSISAGAYDFNAEPYDSVIVKRIIESQSMTDATLDVSYDGVFEVYLIPPTDIMGEVEYDVASSDPDILDATLDEDTKEIILSRAGSDDGSVTITLTGYSPKVAYNTINFTVTLEKITGLYDNNTESNLIYPNPASDYIMLPNSCIEQMYITVYDLRGNVLMNSVVDKSENRIDISLLEGGVYVLKITDTNGYNSHHTFIKQ